MSNSHIIAIDLDGTLLNDNSKITEKSKEVLQKAREKGHHVVIATGRPYRASHMYYKELNLDSPKVNFNGSYVHHPTSNNFQTHHKPLDLAIAKEIFHISKEIGMENMFAEGISNVYAHQASSIFSDFFDTSSVNLHEGDLLKILTEDPTALLIQSTNADKVTEIRNQLTNAHPDIVAHRQWGAPFNIVEVNRTGVSKATGLEKIAAYYGVPKERIIAFGDEDNDLEMLDYVGHGVAMANAIPELKAVANVVAPLTNEEDGVANYLAEYLNL